VEQNLFNDKSLTLRAEHVNAFVVPTLDVLKRMGKIEASIQEIGRRKELETSHPLSIVVGFTGDLKGTFILRFPEHTACAISAGMVGGEQPMELDTVCQEALAELTNVIVGNACGQLAELGIHVMITPPVISTGRVDHRIVTLVRDLIVVPLQTDSGEIELNLSFEMRGLKKPPAAL
jgi:CheY-specific phosphatase CheX